MGLVDERVFVLTVENEILGVIGYSQDEYRISNYWLGWFYVHREYQGKGIGRELLEYILNELQQIGAKTIFVDTSSDALYRRALAIYLKSGFRIEAVIRNYYGKGEDQIILSKKFSYIGGFGA
jgi:ribosomal protein S18 acetylase RimI-like enzyme